MAAKKITTKKVTTSRVKPVIKASNISDRAREIWLAGLGAFAVAQTEGRKIFDTMVAEGERIETATRSVATSATRDLKQNVEGRISFVRDTAEDQINKLEKVFETRVGKTLSLLGVPSKEDIQTLSKRVAELSKEVKALSQTQKIAA